MGIRGVSGTEDSLCPVMSPGMLLVPVGQQEGLGVPERAGAGTICATALGEGEWEAGMTP